MKKLVLSLIMMMGTAILVSACGIKHDLYLETDTQDQSVQSNANQG